MYSVVEGELKCMCTVACASFFCSCLALSGHVTGEVRYLQVQVYLHCGYIEVL